MVHGGLRYLQQRDFRLVYEALHERQRLLENAPHLVAPLPFLIPLFGKDGLVNKGVARTYATALTLYDITGGLRIGKRHRRITKSETLEHLPTLRTDRLVAGFIYYDARADDARLTLTIARVPRSTTERSSRITPKWWDCSPTPRVRSKAPGCVPGSRRRFGPGLGPGTGRCRHRARPAGRGRSSRCAPRSW